MKTNIFLIGAGPMAYEYSRVLIAQKQDFLVIGRGATSAKWFEKNTGIKPLTGGIENYLEYRLFPENSLVIIATGVEDLMPTLLKVIQGGANKILVEKPAALSMDELLSNESILKSYSDRIFVAYNRRFYASVMEAQRLINEDGGLKTMHFEFTEWAHKIETLQKAPQVKQNWFFANSTHLIDLAFFIAGKPVDWKTYSQQGDLSWHNKTNFVGAGITKNKVLFSYNANWESAGRWSIELMTDKRKIYLKPLEAIDIQKRGSLQIEKHKFDDEVDKTYKPGIFMQTISFLDPDHTRLVEISEHIFNTKTIYHKILIQ
jgi:predicted dehydrogenase